MLRKTNQASERRIAPRHLSFGESSDRRNVANNVIGLRERPLRPVDNFAFSPKFILCATPKTEQGIYYCDIDTPVLQGIKIVVSSSYLDIVSLILSSKEKCSDREETGFEVVSHATASYTQEELLKYETFEVLEKPHTGPKEGPWTASRY